jgi:hypothetical protein
MMPGAVYGTSCAPARAGSRSVRAIRARRNGLELLSGGVFRKTFMSEESSWELALGRY